MMRGRPRKPRSMFPEFFLENCSRFFQEIFQNFSYNFFKNFFQSCEKNSGRHNPLQSSGTSLVSSGVSLTAASKRTKFFRIFCPETSVSRKCGYLDPTGTGLPGPVPPDSRKMTSPRA